MTTLTPQQDLEGAFAWGSIRTEHDDGVTTLREHQTGLKRVTTRQDNEASGTTSPEKPWESSTTFHDDQGQIEARGTIFDKGDVTAVSYEDGTKSLRRQHNGDKNAPWLGRETLFDTAAQVAEINSHGRPEDAPPKYGVFDFVWCRHAGTTGHLPRHHKAVPARSGIPDWADVVPQATVDHVLKKRARKPLTSKWPHTKLGAFAATTHSIWGEIQ